MNASAELTAEDYKQLLEFSRNLNPTDKEFRKMAIQLLTSFFSFEGAAFPLIDDNGYYRHLEYVNFTDTAIVAYESHCYKKDFFAPANHNDIKNKSVLTIEDFKTYTEYEESSLYTQCLFHNDFYYEALILLKNRQGNPIGAIAVYHNKSKHGFTSKEEKLLEEIGKIMETATLSHLNYIAVNNNLDFLQNLYFRIPMGLILCNSSFEVIDVNEKALSLLKKLNLAPGIEGARTFLIRQILPLYQKSGAKHYCLLTPIQLEIYIENIIVEENSSGHFQTKYALFIKDAKNDEGVKWLSHLKSSGFSARECEVAELLLLGKSLKDIAESLHISVNTIKRHKESIYHKLGINRISQLHLLYQECMG